MAEPTKVVSVRIDSAMYADYQRLRERIELRDVLERALLKEIKMAQAERQSNTTWDKHQLTAKTRKVLQSAQRGANGEYHWTSGYQLAIRIFRDYPDAFEATGWPIGGVGCGSNHSWTSYIASSLVTRIDAGVLPSFEYSHLDNADIESIQFVNPDEGSDTIESSATRRSYSLSIFRLRASDR